LIPDLEKMILIKRNNLLPEALIKKCIYMYRTYLRLIVNVLA